MGARVLVPEVVDVARRDGRELGGPCQLDELRQDPLLHLEVRVLQLDVDVVAAEHLREPVELGARIRDAVLLERLADPSREAAGERDHAGRVPFEELPVDARLVVVALEVAEARQLDQVRVAGLIGREEREVGVALLLGVAVVGDVDLAADDRLDAGSLGRLEQLHGARHRPVIGERDSRHLELGGAFDEVGDPARTVENRVLGVDVKMNKRCVGHAERTPYKRPRRVPERFPQFGRIFRAGRLWNARGRARAP